MGITLTVTAKGQVTLRKEVLEHLGVRPGDRLEIELLPAGRVQARAKPRRPVSTIFGIMKRPGDRAMAIEDINEASAAAWAGGEDHRRHQCPVAGYLGG
ncbi:MAG TPA: AbrB/MazE/SpoVT family DNA-binding domain-containing protein [Stellaceae bacterium]|nr:AbrB/MazE/SpoVT family DNA-binding domain-containing protein [Stellaceae bacterium]